MIKRLRYLPLILLMSACVHSTFMNRKSETFPASFNKDILFHKKNALEWWYFSGHLKDSCNVNYGFEFAVFNRYIPMWGHRLMLNYSLSKETDSSFYHFVDFARFRNKNRKSSFLEIEKNKKKCKWSLKQNGNGFELKLSTLRGNGSSFSMQTSPIKNAVYQGPNGYMDYGKLDKAGYFSYTRSSAVGRVKIDDTEILLNGQAWMDRQWNCMKLIKKSVSWSWICIQMDSLNSEVMIFKTVDNADNEVVIQGNYIDENGETHFLSNEDIQLESLNNWVSPKTSREYSLIYWVNIPKYKISFTIKPIFQNQEIPVKIAGKELMVYWEGKSTAWGMNNGKSFTAKAFLEMTNQPMRNH